MRSGGYTRTTKRKFTGTTTAENIPNEAIGMISEKAVAMKAMAVVMDVMKIAFAALRHVYAICFSLSPLSYSRRPAACQASVKTNTSSAATPIMIKMASICSALNCSILKIRRYSTSVIGNEKTTLRIEHEERKKLRKCSVK